MRVGDDFHYQCKIIHDFIGIISKLHPFTNDMFYSINMSFVHEHKQKACSSSNDRILLGYDEILVGKSGSINR